MSRSYYLCGRGQRRVCAPRLCAAHVPRPLSHLPAQSEAGLIAVTAGQAVVTATQPLSIVMAGGGQRHFPPTVTQWSESGGGEDTIQNSYHMNVERGAWSALMLPLSDARPFFIDLYRFS